MQEYREFSDKIEGVKDTIQKQMTDVLVEMGKLTASVQSLNSMRTDLDATRDNAREARTSASSAHKRLDTLESEFQPISEFVNRQIEVNSNTIEKVAKIESTIKWVGICVMGPVIAAVVGLVLIQGGG